MTTVVEVVGAVAVAVMWGIIVGLVARRVLLGPGRPRWHVVARDVNGGVLWSRPAWSRRSAERVATRLARHRYASLYELNVERRP